MPNICPGPLFQRYFFQQRLPIARLPKIPTRLDHNTYNRCISWAKRHLVPNCRIIKRLLQLLPWDDDSKIMVVLGIDKRLLGKPDELRAALQEAIDLLQEGINEG